MREKDIFSNGQALGALDSTGVVSTNVFDLELDASGGNTIITNDFLDCWVNCIFTAAPTTQAGVEGMYIEAMASDAAALSTPTVWATKFLAYTLIVAGHKVALRIYAQLALAFFGMWYRAHTTALTTGATIDAWVATAPIGENDSIQKVPSR